MLPFSTLDDIVVLHTELNTTTPLRQRNRMGSCLVRIKVPVLPVRTTSTTRHVALIGSGRFGLGWGPLLFFFHSRENNQPDTLQQKRQPVVDVVAHPNTSNKSTSTVRSTEYIIRMVPVPVRVPTKDRLQYDAHALCLTSIFFSRRMQMSLLAFAAILVQLPSCIMSSECGHACEYSIRGGTKA